MKQNNKTTGYFLIALGILQFGFYTMSKMLDNTLTMKGLILPIVAAAAFISVGILVLRKKNK